MGVGTAKYKLPTALGESHVAMLLDRGSIPLASTIYIHPFFMRKPALLTKYRLFSLPGLIFIDSAGFSHRFALYGTFS